jgi:multiple sugar transport system substrate-binding protein
MLKYKGTSVRDKAETQMIENFMKRYPDIEVAVESIPWTEITRKTILAVKAGRGPDVTRVSFSQIGEHFDRDTLMDLDPFVDKYWTAEKRNDIVGWDSTTYKGKKKSFVIAPLVSCLFYRTDLFAKTGLPEPRTWDDLGRVAQAMTTKDVWGFIAGLSPAKGIIDMFFYPYIWGAGGRPFDENGRAIWNNEYGQQAVQFLYDMVHKYKAMPKEALQYTHDDAMEGMRAGKFGIKFDGSNRRKYILSSKAVAGKIGMWKFPSVEGKKPSPSNIMGWSLAIPGTADHKEEAWKFIDHMICPESLMIYAKVAGEIPSRKSVLKDPYFQGPEGKPFKWFIDYMAEFDIEMPHPHNVGKLRQTLANAIAEAILEKKSIKEALDHAAAEYNKLLEK